jgi:MFS family permease
MNGLQSLKIWRTYFKHPNAAILGTMNSIYPIGKFFGVFATAWTGDRYGRKLPMYIGFLLLIMGAGHQGGANSVAMFIVARLFLGIGTSFVAQPSPIRISELAYPLHRGRITSMYYSTYYVGGILAAWGTYGTSQGMSVPVVREFGRTDYIR